MTLLAASIALPVLLMSLAFLIARRLDNFSIVDIAWSFNFTPIAIVCALLGTAPLARRIAIATLTGVWSLRLAGHLALRIAALHPLEEGRYLELRRRWSQDLNRRFLGFFLIQGALNGVLALPVILISANPKGFPGGWEILGASVFALSLLGETLADRQLAAFKRRERGRGQVCREGLWRYSRHPNYFFEWLVWCAFALMALDAPLGALAWLCPALMLYFLLRVTGIPATEEQALRSRGEAYREYQATTSAFVPWLPARGARKAVPTG